MAFTPVPMVSPQIFVHLGEHLLTCFRFFGQLILLFWTAGGELSDVEEQFREAR